MNDTANIKGLADLQHMLDTLPAKIEANILRGALRAGAKVIAANAKAGIQSHSGDLARSVRYGAKLDRRQGRVLSYVKAGGQGVPGWYARFVELGTKAHLIKVRAEDKPMRMTRGGLNAFSMNTINKMVASGSLKIGGNFVGPVVQHPGARPKPFMRPALDQQGVAAVEAAREYIRNRLSAKHGIDVPGPDNFDDVE